MLHEIIQTIASIPFGVISTISMIVLILLSVLVGFLRGGKKSIFYTIFYVVAASIFMLLVGSITEGIVNANINSVIELICGLGTSNNLNLEELFVVGSESYNLIFILFSFIIQVILCFGFFVSFEIIYKLVLGIIWLIVGFTIDKKKIRRNGQIIKTKRQRIIGATVGLIPGIMSVFMMFIPLSGIFSVASSLTRVEKEDGVSFGNLLSEEDYELLKKSVNSYEESLPGGMFNLITAKDGRSLDLYLFDKLIIVKLDDHEYNVRRDIENIAEFATNIAATGLLDVISNENFTTFELVEVVENNEQIILDSFEALGDVDLIDLVLNTGIEYLDTSKVLDESLELETDSINYENLSKLDWSSEFKQLGNILISATKVLKAIPETQMSTPVVNLGDIDADVVNNDLVLENFVDELFKSKLVNEASIAGLKYVLGMDDVKTIVGDVKANDLKNIDIKEDLLNVVSALKSVINIGLDKFTSVNLQDLSNQSVELKNIVDELLTMELFKIVEDNVLDYAITNYVESDENIVRFVDVEELRKLGSAELKVELGSIIETFGRLGSETELFVLDNLSEEEKASKINYDALNSKALRIITDNVDKSTTIQKFMNKAMQGVLVPTVFEEESEYQEMINEEGFAWDDELYIFTDILESIEEKDTDFNIYRSLNSPDFEITLGLLRGISAKDKLDPENYYLDESIFVNRVFRKMISTQSGEDNIFGEIFEDEDLSYGQEIESLTNILVESEIVENNNEAVIDFNVLATEFNSLNKKKLDALTNNIERSKIIQKVIVDSLEGQVSDNLFDDMKNNWGKQEGRWHDEFESLTNILIDGEFEDENGEIKLDELGENMDEVSYVQMDAIHQNIENSFIIQDVLTTSLVDGGVELPDENNDGVYEVNWKDETEVLRDLIGSETYQYEDNGELVWSKMSISELTELEYVRPESLDLLSRKINKSVIIKDVLEDSLKGMLENSDGTIDDNVNPENWDDETWTKELKSLSYVSEPLAEKSVEKENQGYPADRVYISINDLGIDEEIKLDALRNMLGGKYNEPSPLVKYFKYRTMSSNSNDIDNDFGINHSNVLRKIFRNSMEDNINTNNVESDNYKYNVNFDEFTNEQYYYEVRSILNSCVNAELYTEKDNVKYLVYSELADKLTKITKKMIRGVTSEVSDSIILQKQMQKNLEDSLGEEFTTVEMESWDKPTWYFEMNSLANIVDTMNEDEDGSIDMDSLSKNSTFNLSTIAATRDNSSSKIVKQSMKDKINELIVLENSTEISCVPVYNGDSLVYSGWDDSQWYYEMDTLYIVSCELSEDYETINIDEMKNCFNSLDIKLLEVLSKKVYGSIEGDSKKYNSYILQAQMTPAMENMMNSGERITEDRERSLHPLTYDGANWNKEENVPSYHESDFRNDAKVGEWWDEELDAVVKVAKAKFGENGVLSTENITFNETDIYTLNVVRDSVEKSYVIQSCMRSTVDGILNQDTEGTNPIHPTYEVYTSEYWNGSKWLIEMSAIRDISKSLSVYEGEENISLDSNKVFVEKENYVPSSWIIDERYDKDFTFNLWGIDIESNGGMSLDTLYYVTDDAKTSEVVRSLLRPYVADLLGDKENDDFVNIWLDVNYKSINDNVNNYENRWDYEMEALFNVSGQLAKDGKVNLTSDMMEKFPVTIFDTLNGAFKFVNDNDSDVTNDELIIDEENIFTNHGYIADYSNESKVYYYQSEIISSLLSDSLYEEGIIEPDSWSQFQWAYEVYSLSRVAELLANENNEIEINNINFDNGINIEILNRLSKVANLSTVLQNKLNQSLFEIDSTLSIEKQNELKEAYPDFGFDVNYNQWNYETKALYDVLYGTTYVDDKTNIFNHNNLTFDGVIDASILYNIGENINYSTYLQSELESTIEGLVPAEGEEYYVLDREEYFEKDFSTSTCVHEFNEDILNDHTCYKCGYVKDYHLEREIDELGNKKYHFNIKIRFNDPKYHAWTVELKTIFGIALDEERGLVEDGFVDLTNVEEQLHSLSVSILGLTGDKLDEFGHDAYHASNVVRLNLIKPLETLAYDGDMFDDKAQISTANGYKWINIPIDNAPAHELTWSSANNSLSTFHRYDGVNTFEYTKEGNIIVHLTGWLYGDNNYAYDLNHTLYYSEAESTDFTKVYYKNGLDSEGNEHLLYKLELDNNGNGRWYCIEKQSDLHELETFFKLIGATDLTSAKTILADSSSREIIKTDTRIVNVLRVESYYIGVVFQNRFA